MNSLPFLPVYVLFLILQWSMPLSRMIRINRTVPLIPPSFHVPHGVNIELHSFLL